MKRIARWLFAVGIVGGGLFAVAGTWKDPWLWALLIVAAAVALYAMLSIDEDLARERFQSRHAGADRLSLRAIRILALVHLIVGALDGGRLHWSAVPAAWRIVGLAGFGLSFLLVAQAMRANRFFSAVVRVQDDRGHHVIDHGPYRIIRHPGYAGMIPAMPFSALALGSWPALAVALVYSALIVRRVIFEDRFLHAHLPGYREYAARVKYRLVPGAW